MLTWLTSILKKFTNNFYKVKSSLQLQAAFFIIYKKREEAY